MVWNHELKTESLRLPVGLDSLNRWSHSRVDTRVYEPNMYMQNMSTKKKKKIHGMAMAINHQTA